MKFNIVVIIVALICGYIICKFGNYISEPKTIVGNDINRIANILEEWKNLDTN